MTTIYTFPLSGHAHRVTLFAKLLGLQAEEVVVNLAAGEHKKPEFLAKNPLGQVPVLEDGDVTLSDSNAILVYLAAKYDKTGTWYPADPVALGCVQRWLSLAAGEIAAGPARARLINVFGAKHDMQVAQQVAARVLGFAESELQGSAYLTGDNPTIADVAAYTYIAHAPEGDVSLKPYPALRAWLKRVEALDGFVPMKSTPAGLVA